MGQAVSQKPGEALLIGVTVPEAATLFVLAMGGGAGLEFGDEARKAWKTALRATMNSIPLLWRSPDYLSDLELRCREVGTYSRPTGFWQMGRPVGAVDGQSFGLPFALAQASILFEVPVDAILATGAVEDDGTVGPVEEVFLKVEAALSIRPDIKVIVVAPENYDEALEAAYPFQTRGSQVKVVAARSLEKAIAIAFGDGPTRRLQGLSGEARLRERLTLDLFELAVFHNRLVKRWDAVARAADIVAESKGLSAVEDFRVRFCSAIAKRHYMNTGFEIPVPGEEALKAMRMPMRLRLICHLVQHCADTGVPEVAEARRLAEAYLVRGKEASLEHLRLLGAYGRLLWVTGETRRSLDLEMEASEGFAECLEFREVSWSLSASLLFAGAILDREVFERGKRLWDEIGPTRLDETSSKYVQWAYGAGLVKMGVVGEAMEEAVRSLREVFQGASSRDHVRWSAARYLVRAHRLKGDFDEAERILEEIRRATAEEETAHFARIALALIRLDEDPSDFEAWLELRGLEGGLCGHFEAIAKRSGEVVGEVAARLYPY